MLEDSSKIIAIIQNIARTSFDMNKSFEINVVQNQRIKIKNIATAPRKNEKIFFILPPR